VTLRHRIAGAASLAVAVAVLSAAVIVYFAVRSELRGQVERGLRDTASRFVGGPGGTPGPRSPVGGGGGPQPDGDFQRARPPAPFGGAPGFVQFVRVDGRVDRPPDETSTLPVTRRARALARTQSGRYYTDMHVGGHHLRVLTVGVPGRGALQVARPLDEVDSELNHVLLVLVIVGAAGVALAAALGLGVAQTALRPIRRFTSRTEALTTEADVAQRMEVTGRDELGRLAHSFNTTLDALERSVEAQRHLVADASHELRTPIASLRANIQVLEDADRLSPEDLAALRADVVAELDELTALVADIVELARGTKSSAAADDVRLDQIVSDRVERLERRAGPALTVQTDLEPTVVVGDPERISRAVSNLLDNARKWSPPDGVVEVGLHAGTLTVRDHGPGFAEADLAHVFERFYRAEKARGMPGSGLGLAIVRQTAEAHGGFAEAANAPGGGALMRLNLGAASAPAESDTALTQARPEA
jgi:two-component system, OmpR family, sensor histidine kinase MprB